MYGESETIFIRHCIRTFKTDPIPAFQTGKDHGKLFILKAGLSSPVPGRILAGIHFFNLCLPIQFVSQLLIREYQINISFSLASLGTNFHCPIRKDHFRIRSRIDTKHLERSSQCLYIHTFCFHDKRMFRIMVHLKESLPRKLDFTILSGKSGRVRQLTAGNQRYVATVRQIKRLHRLPSGIHDIYDLRLRFICCTQPVTYRKQ